MSRNVINDGYTRELHILPIEGIHDGLKGHYRPMLPEQVDDLDAAVNRKGAGGGTRILAAGVAKQIVDWEEIDDRNHPVPVSFDSVRRLPYALLATLHKIVTGVRANDPVPTKDQNEQASTDYQNELLAEAEGRAPGDTVSDDQKNS